MSEVSAVADRVPAVSVVIPLYQTERYIGLTLQSVLAQTFRDFEVVVIDDGSMDHGPAIARSFDDARIRVISQINRGLAGARNSGIRHARADLVAFLDADDLWHPEKLARHVAHLTAAPTVGVSFSHSRLVDEEGRALGMLQSPKGGDVTAADLFCRNPVGNGSAPVIRRQALDAIAFHDATLDRICWFDESFRQSEDVECWVRIAATTPWRFEAVREELTDYRVNAAGLSANVEKQLATWRRFRDKVKTYAPALEAAEGRRAEAYQLRYLARRAVRSFDGATAFDLITKAITRYPRILLEEPLRSSVTFAAALGSRLLPRAIYLRCADAATAVLSLTPRLRV